jgi:large subunit ribosomal protein L10
LPTEEKAQAISDIRDWIERSTIAISTNYAGLPVSQITAFRRALREAGVEYRVVKNALAFRAADEAGVPAIKQIVSGPTGIAFGYGEPSEPAKAISNFIRTNRSTMTIIGGVLDGRALSPADIENLATLPPREELIAKLLGQLQAPITGLVRVLNGPQSGLARVLQAIVDKQTQQQAS